MGWHTLRALVVGLIRVAEGLAILLSVGLYWPQWELNFLYWWYTRLRKEEKLK